MKTLLLTKSIIFVLKGIKTLHLVLRKSFKQLFFVSVLLCTFQVFAQENIHFHEDLKDYTAAKEYYEWGNLPLAQEYFDRFLSLTQLDPEQLWQTQQVDAAYHSALIAKRLGQDDDSFRLSQFIDRYGNNQYYNSWANFHLGELFYKKKRYKDAISCFEQIAPEDLKYEARESQLFKLAYAHFNLKDFDEAFPLFHQTSQLKGKHYGDALYYMGFISFYREDYDTALTYFSKLDNEDKYVKVIPYYKTQIYFIRGEYEEIEKYAVPKVKMSGVKYKNEMNYVIGQTYFQQGNFESALPFLKGYVDGSSKVRKEDLYQLAYTQYKFGKYQEAIKNFLDLNTVQDSLGQNAMYHLADCYLKTQEKEKARSAFDDAAQLSFDPYIQEVSSFNYGKLSYELDQDRIAIKSLRKFIDNYPSSERNNEAKNLLGSILENTNNYDEALTIIESIPSPSVGLKRSYQKMAYLRGIELYNDNKTDQAQKLFDQSLTYPESKQVEGLCHFWKGNISYGREDYKGTIREMQRYLSRGGLAAAPASPSSANYTIGYAHFKRKEYRKAESAFKACLNEIKKSPDQETRERIMPDALLRTSDCAFMQRDYNTAQKGYNEVISNNWVGADYATYQKGIISGLNGDYQGKVSTLQSIKSKFPDSYYEDDALFEIAKTQAFQGQFAPAITTYKSLVQNHENSSHYVSALNEMALMHYNLDQYDQAITYFDKVIKEHPNDPEAQNAIVGIKDVFIAKGDSKGYFKYIKGVDNVSFTSSAQDSTRYQFAETLYENGDCTAAIDEFTQYIIEFPNGAFKMFAHYYKGECLYQNKEYIRARGDFDEVLNGNSSLFKEKALDKASRIAYFVDKDYSRAYELYTRLYKLSDKRQLTYEAMKGVARSAYQIENNTATENFANEALRNQLATSEDRVEMEYLLGEAAYRKKNLSLAKDRFFKVSKASTGEKGAISRYRLAQILFQQKLYGEARKAALRINKETPNEEYWVVKGLILAADVDYQKKDFFQAKATLRSILDNYRGDPEIVREVDEKLNRILAEEQSNSKLAPTEAEDGLLKLDEDNE